MNIFRLLTVIIRRRADFNRYSIIKHRFTKNLIIHLVPPRVIAALGHPNTETRRILPTGRQAQKDKTRLLSTSYISSLQSFSFFRISFVFLSVIQISLPALFAFTTGKYISSTFTGFSVYFPVKRGSKGTVN